MKAMILAAGRGERLRPLTDTCPKPLIAVGGKSLILWHIEKLKAIGITELVVNSAYLSDKIVDTLKDGSNFNVHITHSVEEAGGLETAGGIINALDLLGDGPFLVVNGDIFFDCNYEKFIANKDIKLKDKSAYLYLVKNPLHNKKGDFALDAKGNLIYGHDYTFSGVALYKREFFSGFAVQRLPLRPLFDKGIENCQIAGELILDKWFDVGTIDRMNELNTYLKDK